MEINVKSLEPWDVRPRDKSKDFLINLAQTPWVVNPYEKSYFCKLFLCTFIDQGVHPFFLQVKQVYYKIISIDSLFIIYNDFSKILLDMVLLLN